MGRGGGGLSGDRHRKTASQIIAEAKASVCSEGERASGGSKVSQPPPRGDVGLFSQKVLTTKRPFTPRCSERSGWPGSHPLSTGLSLHRHGGLVIVEEGVRGEEELGVSPGVKLTPLLSGDSDGRSNDLLQRSLSAGSTLPAIVPSGRQQFRPSTAMSSGESSSGRRRPSSGVPGSRRHAPVEEEEEVGLRKLIRQLQASQDDACTALALEEMAEYRRAELYGCRQELMSIAARHVTSDNSRLLFPLVELLLRLTRPQGSKTLIHLASKIIFKLSRDDSNDNAFLSRPTLDLLLNALGKTKAYTYFNKT